MGLFSFLKQDGITTIVSKREANSILVDVREQDEYKAGHIPGAVNYPLSTLDKTELHWPKDAVLYVYCLAGTRSRKAVGYLQSQGYTNVKNIGGIHAYRGSLEK